MAKKKLFEKKNTDNNANQQSINSEESLLLNSLNTHKFNLQVSSPSLDDSDIENHSTFELSNSTDKMALGEMLSELQKTKNLVIGNKIFLQLHGLVMMKLNYLKCFQKF